MCCIGMQISKITKPDAKRKNMTENEIAKIIVDAVYLRAWLNYDEKGRKETKRVADPGDCTWT